jgi:hypothetical protein
MSEQPREEADDDCPPICPACGVTQGINLFNQRLIRFLDKAGIK